MARRDGTRRLELIFLLSVSGGGCRTGSENLHTNPDADDRLWYANKKRQVIYTQSDLP